jgi:hypothetical protein
MGLHLRIFPARSGDGLVGEVGGEATGETSRFDWCNDDGVHRRIWHLSWLRRMHRRAAIAGEGLRDSCMVPHAAVEREASWH